jgi:hypothetical protein
LSPGFGAGKGEVISKPIFPFIVNQSKDPGEEIINPFGKRGKGGFL